MKDFGMADLLRGTYQTSPAAAGDVLHPSYIFLLDEPMKACNTSIQILICTLKKMKGV